MFHLDFLFRIRGKTAKQRQSNLFSSFVKFRHMAKLQLNPVQWQPSVYDDVGTLRLEKRTQVMNLQEAVLGIEVVAVMQKMEAVLKEIGASGQLVSRFQQIFRQWKQSTERHWRRQGRASMLKEGGRRSFTTNKLQYGHKKQENSNRQEYSRILVFSWVLKALILKMMKLSFFGSSSQTEHQLKGQMAILFLIMHLRQQCMGIKLTSYWKEEAKKQSTALIDCLLHSLNDDFISRRAKQLVTRYEIESKRYDQIKSYN